MDAKKLSPWNSLEIAKLAVSCLTPLLVLILGIAINSSLRNAELRTEIYRDVGGNLNDIYAYVSFVGGWKELTPVDILERKRKVDKAMYTYRPFFSAELFDTYEEFMAAVFKPYGGPGQDARIRSDISTPDGDRRIHSTNIWNPAWEDRFTKERNKNDQRNAYDRFLNQLARDLSL